MTTSKVCAGALAVTAAALGLAACGGSDDSEEARAAAEPAVLRQARESLEAVPGPSYTDMSVSRPTLEAVRVVEERAGRRLTGRVRAEVKLTPKPDKAPFLRVLPEDGASTTVTRAVSVSLFKNDQGKWETVAESVEVSEPGAQELSPADQEQARLLAVKAMTTLLTWPGTVDDYNRAQGRFYATRPASEADFNQPGFDPAPAITLASDKDSFDVDVPVGAAWQRTNDGGADDVPLGAVLDGSPFDYGCGIPFELETLRPTTVGGQPATTEATGGELEQTVIITGQAVVEAGDWVCTSGYPEKTRNIGPREVSVAYQASVSRLRVGGQSSWFISGLALSPGDADPASTGEWLYELASAETVP